jgi:hypothetical protein
LLGHPESRPRVATESCEGRSDRHRHSESAGAQPSLTRHVSTRRASPISHHEPPSNPADPVGIRSRARSVVGDVRLVGATGGRSAVARGPRRPTRAGSTPASRRRARRPRRSRPR